MSQKPERMDPSSPDYRSKADLKREIQEITKLGERLLSIPAAQLEEYPLSATSIKALLEGQKINSNIGKKRQIKYIGKLLREEDLTPVKAKLLLLDQQKILDNKQFHQWEQWRDRLIQEGDSALTELLSEYPHLDRQQLRQTIRNAQSEIKNNKPPKFQRQLFQYLKQELSH